MGTKIETIGERRRRIEAGSLNIGDVRRDVETLIARNEKLNEFISVMLDDTSNGDIKRPLAGVPIGIKDFFDTAGVRTTAGAAQYAKRVPTEDAEVVRKLKSLGAMIVGKTNMHTLGMGTTTLESHFGPVRNPWMPDRVAGGSSGGSAAAVAVGICFATIDTDAVGSARLPAACCAVTAFKPTYGTLPTDGILRGEPVDAAILALNHTSITARSAEDAAFLFAMLSDAPRAAADSSARLGVVQNYSAAEPMRQRFEGSLPSITSIAASNKNVVVPFSEVRFDPTGIEAARAGINQRLFTDVDLIVLPTLADPVPTIEQARRDGAQAVSPANTFFANYFGLPAISIPIGVDEQLGPVALQIVGPVGADTSVLGFAMRVQEQYPPVLAGS
jgi:aspartyl-tRNA(Asn)/glutamyl-tRNA(Gln) amidotransferase subunit A